MKTIARKIVTYTALNLVITLPFAMPAFAEQNKNVTLATNIKPAAPVKPTTASTTTEPAVTQSKGIDKKATLTKHKPHRSLNFTQES